MSTIKHSELEPLLDRELYLMVKTVSMDPVYYICDISNSELFKRKIKGSSLKFLIGKSVEEEMTLSELPYYIFKEAGITINCNCMFECKCYRRITLEVDGRMLRATDKGISFF